MPKLDSRIYWEKGQPALFLPKAWVKKMGLSQERSDLGMSFDGRCIVLERPEEAGHVRPLADKARMWRFAIVWRELFRLHAHVPWTLYDECVLLGDECRDLGFEMDCGASLREAFPDRQDLLFDVEAFAAVVDRISDRRLLGNAIFSQWRSWNHWANAPMTEEAFAWYELAFSRLAVLCRGAGEASL